MRLRLHCQMNWTGRTSAAGGTIKGSVRKMLQVVVGTTGVHTVQDGTMAQVFVERKRRVKTVVTVLHSHQRRVAGENNK